MKNMKPTPERHLGVCLPEKSTIRNKETNIYNSQVCLEKLLDATGKKSFLRLPSELLSELILKSNTTHYTENDKKELSIIIHFFENLNILHENPTTDLLNFHQSLYLFLEILRSRLTPNIQN